MFLIWVSFRGFAIVEIFRFYDEGDYECEIFFNTKQCLRTNQRHFGGKTL